MEINDEEVVVDANHELAGQILSFDPDAWKQSGLKAAGITSSLRL